MPPKINAQERIQEIGSAIKEVSSVYNGTAIFVPTPDVVARVIGLSRGPMYADGTTFEQKIEAATDYTVLHNGIVLGKPEALMPPQMSNEAFDRLKTGLDSIHHSDRDRILAYLAIHRPNEE